ncbi:MAG: hypothetical protein M1817_006392 [Caeruleum heppii]|nr:MAG: hypothetical protein M1817_006392 [Caeruleum heppii]
MLGKRKRFEDHAASKAMSTDPAGSQGSQADMASAFRRHFEAQFEPFEIHDHPSLSSGSYKKQESGDDDESSWDGLSGSEEGGHIEVIEHDTSGFGEENIPKVELKTFMSSKPPSIITKTIIERKSNPTGNLQTDNDDGDAANLKKDLALQRLLQESHLLDPVSSLAPSGSNRHKAIDLRVQSLGSKSSILTQAKMPMSHRKGMIAKAAQREDRRRREAKENGIVLEKVQKLDAREETTKRERGIGAPAVGTFKRGSIIVGCSNGLVLETILDIICPSSDLCAEQSIKAKTLPNRHQ